VSVADSQQAAVPFRDRRAKKPAREPVDLLAYTDDDDTSWLLPYVDVISLLLAFLILALAMSKVSLHRFELVSAALSRTAPPPSLDVLKEKIDQMIETQGLVGQVKTAVDDAGLRMELKNALLFDSGQADITAAGRSAIEKVVKLLPTIDQRYQIAIEGHTDDVPIHTAKYDSNWDLSSGRAISVLKIFTVAGISPQRLSAQGYADTRPATPLQGDNATVHAKARSENRRVVIRVY
jgi:chemotaxis protein MotB